MKEKQNTRDVILQTATRLFQRQGYNGTGLNQIIEESGAPKGSIYYHFPNGKEEIAIEAISMMRKLLLEGAEKDLTGKNSAAEAFEYYLYNVAAVFDMRSCIDGLSIGLIASETAFTHENLRYSCEMVFKDLQSLHAQILVQYGFEREQAEELGITIAAMIEGACILSITYQDGNPLRKITKPLSLLLKRSQERQEEK
ncbi:TetR/AcrR family transcriptional regulator [Lysinibacillus sp. SGAir0095]|uniref:TetR/AcrR family transcriptional regulator n=1 Tax=Lysinibacillus sp. SGAir0095 TaxID=2070463 RepID=UPI0010CD276B|nr:TetR/AcrR family transcriptional regulator [Lysinibacillus sp. SGAir0095]QCR33951.1 TetR/AcrR family transcriptional regulator [Lysinibacillus sp. SGAir0095]